MLEAIRRFVKDRVGPDSSEAPAGTPPNRVQLAACALLLELAHADNEFSAGEVRHIEEVEL
ncbi:MAG TPA: hypothetical protein VGP44_03505 [Gemmatimonadales bacterium]|nr:hypothetical protein [Gemmatimonadales bacterium]